MAAPNLCIDVRFPGGKRVLASVGEHEVTTDQPLRTGGDGTAPTPFELFLASLATCAGYFVLEFCNSRGIPLEGVTLQQTLERDPETRRVALLQLRLGLPAGFPDKYRSAVANAAASCAVKKLIEDPPSMQVVVEDA